MTPHIRRFVLNKDYELFMRIRAVVEKLPDIDLGRDEDGENIILSCHMLARALGKVFGLRWVDGLYAGIGQHSWLVFPHKMYILDCYPVHTLGGPLLVNAKDFLSPGQMLYKPKRHVISSLPFRSSSFRRSVRLIERAIRAVQGAPP